MEYVSVTIYVCAHKKLVLARSKLNTIQTCRVCCLVRYPLCFWEFALFVRLQFLSNEPVLSNVNLPQQNGGTSHVKQLTWQNVDKLGIRPYDRPCKYMTPVISLRCGDRDPYHICHWYKWQSTSNHWLGGLSNNRGLYSTSMLNGVRVFVPLN